MTKNGLKLSLLNFYYIMSTCGGNTLNLSNIRLYFTTLCLRFTTNHSSVADHLQVLNDATIECWIRHNGKEQNYITCNKIAPVIESFMYGHKCWTFFGKSLTTFKILTTKISLKFSRFLWSHEKKKENSSRTDKHLF